jgi:hypothetical protein
MARKPPPANFAQFDSKRDQENVPSQNDVRSNLARGLDQGGVPFGQGGKKRTLKQVATKGGQLSAEQKSKARKRALQNLQKKKD